MIDIRYSISFPITRNAVIFSFPLASWSPEFPSKDLAFLIFIPQSNDVFYRRIRIDIVRIERDCSLRWLPCLWRKCWIWYRRNCEYAVDGSLTRKCILGIYRRKLLILWLHSLSYSLLDSLGKGFQSFRVRLFLNPGNWWFCKNHLEDISSWLWFSHFFCHQCLQFGFIVIQRLWILELVPFL